MFDGLQMSVLNRFGAIAVALTCAACDGATTVRGTLRTEDGSPISDAEVKVVYYGRSGRTAKSDAAGVFEAGVVHQPGLDLQTQMFVAAPGYAPVAINLVGTASYRCDIRLKPGGSSEPPLRWLPWPRVCKKET